MDRNVFTGVHRFVGSADIHLDVGGKLFMIKKVHIDRFPTSLIAKMVASCPEAIGKDKPFFIDRNPKGFEIVQAAYRTGRLFPLRLPENYGRAHLSSDLDFYQLPWSLNAAGNSDGNTLRALSDSLLNACIDDLLKNLQENPRGLVEGTSFAVYWKRTGELGAARTFHWNQANLTQASWQRMVSLLKQRGFRAEVKGKGKDARVSITW